MQRSHNCFVLSPFFPLERWGGRQWSSEGGFPQARGGPGPLCRPEGSSPTQLVAPTLGWYPGPQKWAITSIMVSLWPSVTVTPSLVGCCQHMILLTLALLSQPMPALLIININGRMGALQTLKKKRLKSSTIQIYHDGFPNNCAVTYIWAQVKPGI